MECAEKFACDGIAPPRKDCGSTDFGAVTHRLPSCCLRVKTIETDDPPHTDAWVKTGKEAWAHQGIYDGAVCCALAAWAISRVHCSTLSRYAMEEWRISTLTLAKSGTELTAVPPASTILLTRLESLR